MKNTIRTFIAVEIDAAVRNRAEELTAALRAARADVKWVEANNLHLTLKFLGDVPAEQIPEVSAAVAGAVAGRQPLELEIRGAGAFPNANRPRTVWLGGGSGQQELAAVQERIDAALEELGFRREDRAFQVHLTIGRVRSGGPAIGELAKLLRQHADFQAGRSAVGEVVVFSSQLTPKGPIYQALSRAKLGGF